MALALASSQRERERQLLEIEKAERQQALERHKKEHEARVAARKRQVPKTQAPVAPLDFLDFDHDDLKKAIIYSEILKRPNF